MQNSGQTTVVLFGNALDPRGRTNHPQPASPRPHGKPVAPVLAKNQPVWRSRPSKTLVTGRTQLMSVLSNTKHEAVAQAYIADPTKIGWRAYKAVYPKSSQQAAETQFKPIVEKCGVCGPYRRDE